jgi:hypothetical protein
VLPVTTPTATTPVTVTPITAATGGAPATTTLAATGGAVGAGGASSIGGASGAGGTTAITTTIVPAQTPIAPSASGDPPHTIRCTASAAALTVTVTGPITDALIAVPTRPYALMWGSDTAGGWPVPYREGDPSNRTQLPWLGDTSTYALTMPAWTDRLNLYVADADSATRDSWFDLDLYMDGFVPWNVIGDCRWMQGLIVRK